MCLTPDSIRCVDDGLMLHGPKGPVRIRRCSAQLELTYQGSQLVNGNATRYAEALLAQAIQLSETYPFAWTIADDGRQCITDHSRYYEQTFMPQLRGIETLKYWLSAMRLDRLSASKSSIRAAK